MTNMSTGSLTSRRCTRGRRRLSSSSVFVVIRLVSAVGRNGSA
jgi:hypothetical protein